MTHPPAETPHRHLLPDLAQLPGHLLWRAHARVQTELGQTLPPGTDIHAYGVLLALADGSSRSQQWLATTIKVSRTTMAKVAAELASDGLVDRVRNPEDRRSYALTRTPAGARAARSWAQHAAALDARLADAMSPGERAELADLLRGGLDPAHDEERLDGVPEELTGALAFLVTRLHQVVHRELLLALSPLGLEPRHLGTLTALGALGPVAQTELARELGVSPPSIVEIVDGLEASGLVERRRAAGDRRTQMLHLTSRCSPVTEAGHRVAGEVATSRFGASGDVRRERLVVLLRRFVVGD